MQSPFVIGVASIVPGLGFILLAKYRSAVNSFFIVVGLFVAGLFIASGIWSDIFIEFSALIWIGQIVYAVQTANIQKKREAGEIISPREATPLSPIPSNLSRGERLAFKIAETIRQQLQPGEILKDAVLAQIMPSMGQHVLWGAASMLSMKQYYLGTTNQGIVFLELDMFGKPFQINRVPAERIKSIEFKKDFLQDSLSIHLTDEKPLGFKVSYLLRKHTENMPRAFQSQ